MIRRREVITLLGVAVAARAQLPAVPVIGYLSARSPDESLLHLDALDRKSVV